MKFYELADYLSLKEREQFGLKDGNSNLFSKVVKAVYTGQKRCPKKGEWYLSGAEVQAWKAPNDLSTVFHIAKLVKTKTETKIVVVN